jgi:hypothetical protein
MINKFALILNNIWSLVLQSLFFRPPNLIITYVVYVNSLDQRHKKVTLLACYDFTKSHYLLVFRTSFAVCVLLLFN